MTPLKSSTIASADYDAASETLTIVFKSGGIYEYKGVPLTVFRELTLAPSVGKYFHQNIRSVFPVAKFEKDVAPGDDLPPTKAGGSL